MNERASAHALDAVPAACMGGCDLAQGSGAVIVAHERAWVKFFGRRALASYRVVHVFIYRTHF